MFCALVEEGLDRPPLPGSGETLERWRCLVAVAQADLVLAKLYEGHADALAILAELGGLAHLRPGQRWCVWAADPPHARPQFVPEGTSQRAVLNGRKAWCSGAAVVTHALVTAYRGEEGPYLVVVDLAQAGVRATNEGWEAVGMADSHSVEVEFRDATVEVLGPRRAYLERPGFWHGGAGIAACWLGGAVMLARSLRAAFRAPGEDLKAAHLGLIDSSLQSCLALLRESARMIDRDPHADAQALALRCRSSAELTAELVLRHTGRALGAAPFCRNRQFARHAADLPVYLRQSHAESDLACLARLLPESLAWSL